MAYEHREGGGAIFKVNQKTSEKAPDYRGTVMVGGVVYELAGWLKAGAKGNFLSLKATPQEANRGQQHHRGSTVEERDSGDIPF